MPSWPMSSKRPTKGDTNAAPDAEASSAWAAVKTSVMLTRMSSAAERRRGREALGGHRQLDHDVRVDRGEAAALLDHVAARVGHDLGGDRPVHQLADAAVDVVGLALDLAEQSVGLVVTPESTPHPAIVSMSARSAVSMKSFMPCHLPHCLRSVPLRRG